MPIHVFIDNSNVFGGAQRAARSLEPGVPGRAVRVYYRNLFILVEREREAATRILAGSIPPGNETLWQHARDGGYDTNLLQRVPNDDGKLVEQAVDEMLHLKIANALLDHKPPQTLVIVSGDGRQSQFDTSFPAQARRAMNNGWNVEVWSWSEQLSTAGYRDLLSRHAGQITLHRFDTHYHSLTFVNEGTYEANGSMVQAKSRVVSPLPSSTKGET